MTDTVTYAWTGTPNASPSVEYVNGAVSRTNLAPNPRYASTSTVGWGVANECVPDFSGSGVGQGVRYEFTGTTVSDSGANLTSGISLSEGYYRVSFDLTPDADLALYNPYASGGAWRQTFPGGVTTRTSYRFHSPGSEAYILRTDPSVTTAFRITNVDIELDTGSTLPYFDGDTPAVLWGESYAWTGAADASPSIERVDGQITRTNEATYPYPISNTNPLGGNRTGWTDRWFGNGSDGVETLVTDAVDGPAGITTYSRKTWTSLVYRQDVAWGHTGGPATEGIAVTPGETLTISTYIRSSSSEPVGDSNYYANFIGANSYDVNGVQLDPYFHGATPGPFVAGQWLRFSLTITVPDGVAYLANLYTQVYLTDGAAGDTLDGTGLLIERTGTLGDYFDGDTAWNLHGEYAVGAAATGSVTEAFPELLATTSRAASGTSGIDTEAEFLAAVAALGDGSVSAWGVEPRPFAVRLPSREAVVS